MSKRLAAIDIGTNTILMVIAEVEKDSSYKIISDSHEIARLGEGLGKTGRISDDAIERGKTILSKYSIVCNENQVDKINVVCTSALRDAENSANVIHAFKSVINAEFDIISGLEEAQMSYSGTAENYSQTVVIDIGGGSTEFISGDKNQIINRKSLQIGAVRLTEKFFKAHPPLPYELQNSRDYIQEILGEIDVPVSDNIYAVAGTPTTLAHIELGLKEYDFDKVHGYSLKLDTLDDLLKKFISNDLNYIIDVLHVHPKRADVITMGTLILIESLKHLKSDRCTVSAKGLRFGLLHKMIADIEIS